MAASHDSNDSDSHELDDELSPELSAQLGDLILGAAQQFNVDNPNIGLNFMQVFGGDEDFGFNPGDEEMMDFMDNDSDSDSYFDDVEDSVQQIFTSLGDSHVIRRLSYHKNVANSYQFPRVTRDSEYCYEEVYRLLEELELLAKVWRRRVEHPFTAHIESPSQGGDWLREGEDYSSSDYEYESDAEEADQLQRAACPGPGQDAVNESLTKKKFCQSAKIFYQVFSSLNQYESFIRFVSKTKKYIFRIIFRLFLETIPEDTRFKIPEELWEKVWKYTQNGHFKYKSHVPITADNTYYKAGIRAVSKNEKLKQIETRRVNELFGALGNLHMFVFEILFKNPHLLQPTAMLELEVGALSECYCAGAWREAAQAARTSVVKLRQLDSFLSGHKAEGGEAAGRRRSTELSLSSGLEQGAVHIRDLKLQLEPDTVKLGPAASLLVAESVCGLVCLPASYSMEETERLGLMLVIISVEDNCRVLHRIRTPIRYEHHLIEVGSHRVIRKNESGWKKHFYLSADRITFVSSSCESAGRDVARVWSVPLGGAARDIEAGDCLLESSFEAADEDKPRPGRSCRALAVSHSSCGVAVVHQAPHARLTRVSVHCARTGETLLSVPFTEDISLLHSGCASRLLLRSAQSRSILLFSLQSGEVVYHWREADLNRTFNIPEDSSWSALFDTASTKPQLCLYTKTLSGFSLNYFDADNEMSRPSPHCSGRIPEGVTGLGSHCRLVSGNLVTNTSLEVLGAAGGAVRCHQLAAFCLARKTKHVVATMGAGGGAEEPLLNTNTAHQWTDEAGPSGGWDPERRPVLMPARSKLALLLEQGDVFRVFDAGMSPVEIVNMELHGGTRKKNVESNGVKQEDLKRKKLAIGKELSDKDEFHIGTVIEWKGTYGFMKSSGRAKNLGKIFFHINDVQNKQAMKKSLRKGQKLEFKIIYNSCDDSFKTAVYKCISN